MFLKLFFLCFALFSLPFQAWAWDEASPSVPIENSVYDDLDVLAAHELIDGFIVGQRPFTRAEVARMIDQANQKFHDKLDRAEKTQTLVYNQSTQEYLEALLDQLIQDFPYYTKEELPTLETDLLEEVQLRLDFLNSSPRPYFGSGIDALYNPLVENQQGRHLVDGSQTALELTNWARVSPYFSLYFHPRLQLQFVNGQGPEENEIFIQELYATASFFNTQFDIGRKPMHWGQSRSGGMMFSNNARPLDAIQLTNPTAWKIPYLGYLKYTFFFGTLGPDYNFSNAQISGGKITLKPFPFLEFGVARSIIFSGEGAPYASSFDIFKEFFGYRGQSQFGPGGSANLSNAISGFEFRANIPPLQSLNLYGEFYFDDFTLEHAFRSLEQDSAILLGLYLPRLSDSGDWNLRVEGRKTTSISYKHGIWLSGWTLNDLIMGDPLGPDAESLHTHLSHSFNHLRTKISHQFYLERIDSDIYSFTSQIGNFVVVNGTPEWRVRNLLGVNHKFNKSFSGDLTLGYERVKNFNFVTNDSQNNFLVQAMINFDSQGRFHYKQ